MWDVVVVGGGPGGAIVAKKCAENNLRTLLLEKRELPRKKVCTGMVMSLMANNIIQQEFGEIPEKVLTTPHYLEGICFHPIPSEDYQIRAKMPLTWRRDLDFWLIEKARQAGVHVWTEAKVTSILEKPKEYLVRLIRKNIENEITGRFLVGADGATSVVRKYLFPQLKTIYNLGYRECHRVNLGLDKNYWHVFFHPGFIPYYFSVIHKEIFMLIEFGTRPKGLKKSLIQAHDTLAETFGFNLGVQPLWQDACAATAFYRELFSGSFSPAKGNSLLVGDAAGFILPLTGEGIGTALKSGWLAATAILEANRNNYRAGDLYLEKLKELISDLKKLYGYVKKVLEQTNDALRIQLLKEGWQQAMMLR